MALPIIFLPGFAAREKVILPLDEYLPTTFVFERRGDRWLVIHAQRTADYETVRQLVALTEARMKSKDSDSKR